MKDSFLESSAAFVGPVTHALLPPLVVADLPESLGLVGLLVGGESRVRPTLLRAGRVAVG